MRRIRTPIGWPETLFAGFILVAFLVGATGFGRVAGILNNCSTSRCQPVELYVQLNVGTGLVTGLIAVLVLLTLGALRDRRSS